MAAISHYIKNERPEGREALRQVSLGTIWGATQVERARLTLIVAGLWVLLRLPRMEWVAQRMLERWHVKRPPRGATIAPAR